MALATKACKPSIQPSWVATVTLLESWYRADGNSPDVSVEVETPYLTSVSYCWRCTLFESTSKAVHQGSTRVKIEPSTFRFHRLSSGLCATFSDAFKGVGGPTSVWVVI